MKRDSDLRWLRRRNQSHLLFVLAAMLAVASVLASLWHGPSWAVVAATVIVAVSGLVLGRLKEDAHVEDARQAVLEGAIRTTGRPGLPIVGQMTPGQLGVHKALESVPYLARDVERNLIEALMAAKPVLLVGNSMAGKTRVAAKVVRQMFPDRLIVIPNAPAGLADLIKAGARPRDAVIWLDHLESYIDNPGNLEADWLEMLTASGNVVVATIEEEPHERFMPTGTLPSTQWQLMAEFHLIRMLERDEERHRLADQIHDPRVRAGIIRYGLGAYIGGGRLAVERLQAAENRHPLAYGLMRAAVDWRRSGLGEVIPEATALALAPAYMTSAKRDDEREPRQHAIDWVTSWETGRNAFRLLTPQDGGWRVFDYLVDHVTALEQPIPSVTWDAVAIADATSSELNSAGLTAYRAGLEVVAERLFQRTAELGNALGMANLGRLVERRGEHEQAQALYWRAVELGNPGGMANLGVVLERRGDHEQAEVLYRQAAELGNPFGMVNLALILERRRDYERAEALYWRAAKLGNPGGIARLGWALERRGERRQAEVWYRQAAEMDSPLGMVNLGAVLERRGDREQAEALYRRAAEVAELDNPGEMVTVGAALERRGDHEQAEALFRRGADLGNPAGMFNLGLVLERRGEHEQANALYRRAAKFGSPAGMVKLGMIMERRGEPKQAEALYRRAAELSNPTGKMKLGEILEEQ